MKKLIFGAFLILAGCDGDSKPAPDAAVETVQEHTPEAQDAGADITTDTAPEASDGGAS